MAIDLEDAEVMSALAKMALESATRELATKAREFAGRLPQSISGSGALLAFAAAIESTNKKVWPAASA